MNEQEQTKAQAAIAAELERRTQQTRAEFEAADARISENADGSLIVQLVEPIRIGEDVHARLTVQRVKVRHARATWGAEYEIDAYARQLVLPAGALDELTAEIDYIACCRAAERALGKFRAAGR